MKDSSNNQANSDTQPIRQPYQSPTLTKLGAVSQLTAGGSGATGEPGPGPDPRRP